MRCPEILSVAINLLGKAVVLGARWAGTRRRHGLAAIAASRESSKDKEIIFLRDRVAELQSQVEILRQLHKPDNTTRYTPCLRLRVIFHLTYFGVPRRKVEKCLGIARSTLYRWLHNLTDRPKRPRKAWNRTPAALASLVWDIARANWTWGRVRIANQLRLLGVFVSPSAVRNILNRELPPPSGTDKSRDNVRASSEDGRSIAAFHPNHVWSVDLTEVLCWGMLRVYVIVAIDHFSRKLVCVKPLRGSSTESICAALEATFRRLGPPKHLISDRQSCFDSAAMRTFLKGFGVLPRYGAVGKHGSIAVTERAIKTLKYEWLCRVPLIRGANHLAELCALFIVWHNEWRPHMTLGGCRPADFYCREAPEPVAADAKAVPLNIERHRFEQTRVTGFRLREAA
jgi:transposase InsO family protein